MHKGTVFFSVNISAVLKPLLEPENRATSPLLFSFFGHYVCNCGKRNSVE